MAKVCNSETTAANDKWFNYEQQISEMARVGAGLMIFYETLLLQLMVGSEMEM